MIHMQILGISPTKIIEGVEEGGNRQRKVFLEECEAHVL